MALFRAYGKFLQPWAWWHLGEREGNLAAMRRGIAACHDMGNAAYMTLLETALAEAEACRTTSAIARIGPASPRLMLPTQRP